VRPWRRGGDAIQAHIKALSAVAVLVALTTLATPAQGRGGWGAALVSSFAASTEISSHASSEASSRGSSDSSSDSSSDRKRSAKDRRSEQLRYLTDNYDAIMRDGAAGGGEHLGALARLLGCTDDVRPRLFHRVMTNHHRIFAFDRGDGQVNMHSTLSMLKRVLAEDPNLADRCNALPRPPRSSAAATLTASVGWTPRRAMMCHPQPL
jgi:Protein of unknown function (DUF3015)